jgi:colanic acid/amylovoran biosynthesis glycosyltransferase
MHVGYILKKFPRLSETFVLNEILELERQGAEVTVFSLNKPDDGVFHAALSQLRRPVVYLPVRKSDAWLQHLRQNLGLLRDAAPALFGEFEDLLAAGRPDVWSILGWGVDLATLARDHGIRHFHAHFATVAAYVARTAHALSGVPFSVTCHAKDIYRDGIVPAHFQRLLARAAFIVTVCEANRRWIETQLAGDTPLDVRVLYNGIDTVAFHPSTRQPAAEPTLLAVGRLVEKKGFRLLIDALAALARDGQHPRCLLVGDGEDRAKLVAHAHERGVSTIEFLGMRTHEEVRELMRAATLMVLPCVVGEDGNRDALPTVLLEALAAGLPIVSTPVGGIAEIIEPERTGLLVPPGDVDALAGAIARALRDPARTAALAQAGRGVAESRFDLRANVATLRNWQAASGRGRMPEEAVA